MSTLEEKLAEPTPAASGPARQTLGQLRKRWGAVFSGPDTVGDRVHVGGMSSEVWVRSGPTRGDATVYELEAQP